jgi:hypothetical protein
MKIVASLSLLVLAVFATGCPPEDKPGTPADVSGTWTGMSTDTAGGKTHAITFVVEQSGADVAGTGSVDATNVVVAGKVSGSHWTGTLSLDGSSVSYDLKVDGDTATGTGKGADGKTATLVLSRTMKPSVTGAGGGSGMSGDGGTAGAAATVDVTGTWSGTITKTSGATHTLTVTVEQTGTNVTGTGKIDTTNVGVTGTVSANRWTGTLTFGDSAAYALTVEGDLAVGTGMGKDGLTDTLRLTRGTIPTDGGAPDTTALPDANVAPLVEVLAAAQNDPVAPSLDATHVYWLNGGTSDIRRLALGGAGQTPTTVVTGLSVSSSVVVTGGSLFWTNGFRAIMTCVVAADGACAGTMFADLGTAPTPYPAHLFVYGTRLYWVSENAQARLVQVCPLAGCTAGYPKTVLTSAAGSPIHNIPVAGLAVDATSVYLASFTGGIFRVTLTDPETATLASATQLSSSAYGTSELDLDGTTLRWGLLNDGKVAQCALPACTPVSDTLTGQMAPGGVRTNATHLYGFNRGTPKTGQPGYTNGSGSIWRLAK